MIPLEVRWLERKTPRHPGARPSNGWAFACVTALVVGIGAVPTGCRRPVATTNGVVSVFGRVGLAPGSFHYPRAIAAEPNGSVFVVDKSGRIQRFGEDGHYELSWPLPKTDEGFPVGLSVDPRGRLLVADTHNHRVLVFDRDGGLVASFGRHGTGDGEFLLPTDVTVDSDGRYYVAEYQGNDRITRWSPDFSFLDVVSDTPIDGERLSRPAGIVIDDEQTLWVADACNHRIVRMSLDGEPLLTIGRFGHAQGELRYPYDVCLSPEGTIMVCEYEGNRLQWFSKDGRSLRVWGRPGRERGELFAPWGATYGPNGQVYVVDSRNNRVQIIRP